MLGPIATFRTARAVKRLVADPERLDEVFTIVRQLKTCARTDRTFEAALGGDPRLVEAIRARRRTRVVLVDLAREPAGSLGRATADLLAARALDPNDIEVDPIRSDLDYIDAHLRETHDLWHVVTGFSTDIAGELGLQAFYLAQVRLPLAPVLLAGGLIETFLRGMDDADARVRAIARGWILGKQAQPLFGYDWGARWSRPLAAVRAELGLDPDAIDGELARLLRAA